MLSDLTILILAIMTPIMGVFCFIKGFNVCAKSNQQPEITTTFIKPHKSRKKRKEDEKLSQILANIDVYDGTEKGQKTVNG